MNLAKSKVILKKIKTLHDNIELGEGMSKIEKDLFLDYLKELYEIVLDGKHKKEKKPKYSLVSDLKKSSSTKDKENNVNEFERLVEKEDVKTKKPKASEQEMVEIEETTSNATLEPKPNGVHKESSQNGINEGTTSTVSSIDPEILALFDEEIIDKTSYRFSQTPISDISKAMGINERILTVNLLFNKDQQDFNYVAAKLNYFNTFAEASNYLKTEIADKYEWAHNTKRSKAIEFIKLVRRKYNS